MSWISARTIVEETSVSKEIDRLCKAHKRFDEAYEAIKWLLARRCAKIDCLTKEVGRVEYKLYRVAGDSMAKTPDTTILFTFDDNEVNIIGIKAETSSAHEE